MSQGKTYVVTGGAGFIGSNIAEALRRRGDRVRILDNFSTGRRENVESIGDVEVIEGDLRDPQAVRRAVTGADGVFHQAALRSVPRSVDDPLSSNDVNVTGTLVLLMACRAANVRRVVYASSSSVYGDDPGLPKVETQAAHPISPYAVSKLAAEVLPRLFEPFSPGDGRSTGFGLYIVRCLAEALGGRVAARSEPGEGTAVTVELPLAAPVR